MKAKAVDDIDARKQEVGKGLFKPQEDGPENTEQPADAEPPEASTETETEEPKNETDQGGD